MLKGFRNFLLRNDVVVVAVGLAIALAFSTLIRSFTTDLVQPLVNRAQGKNPISLGVQLGKEGNTSTFLNFGDFIGALIYFLVFMAVVYFLIVVPYKVLMARRGNVVFGEPAATKTCPACRSDDIPEAASKCKYCGTELSGSVTSTL
jgi:large conductance mechanosensitive channel